MDGCQLEKFVVISPPNSLRYLTFEFTPANNAASFRVSGYEVGKLSSTHRITTCEPGLFATCNHLNVGLNVCSVQFYTISMKVNKSTYQ